MGYAYNPFTGRLDAVGSTSSGNQGLSNAARTRYSGSSVVAQVLSTASAISANNMVMVGKMVLDPSVDYSVSGTDITFNIAIDAQDIIVVWDYARTTQRTRYVGSDVVAGVLTHSETVLPGNILVVGRLVLDPLTEYSVSGADITFNIPIDSADVVILWS